MRMRFGCAHRLHVKLFNPFHVDTRLDTLLEVNADASDGYDSHLVFSLGLSEQSLLQCDLRSHFVNKLTHTWSLLAH